MYISSRKWHLIKFPVLPFDERNVLTFWKSPFLTGNVLLLVWDLMSRRPDADLKHWRKKQDARFYGIYNHLCIPLPEACLRTQAGEICFMFYQGSHHVQSLGKEIKIAIVKRNLGEENSSILFSNSKLIVKFTRKNVRRVSCRSSKGISKVCCSS